MNLPDPRKLLAATVLLIVALSGCVDSDAAQASQPDANPPNADTSSILGHEIADGAIELRHLTFPLPSDARPLHAADGSGLQVTSTPEAIRLSTDYSTLQRRVTTDCGPGQALRAIAEQGTGTCEPTSPAGVRQVSVVSGSGLVGGGSGPDISLGTDSQVLQARVSGSCGAGSAIASVRADGTVGCVSVGPSGITDVKAAAGSGLTTTTTSQTVTLGVDPTVVQRRVAQSCVTGLQQIRADGSVLCLKDLRPRTAYVHSATSFQFATSCKTVEKQSPGSGALAVTIQVPEKGTLVVEAKVRLEAQHESQSTDRFVLQLATAQGECPTPGTPSVESLEWYLAAGSPNTYLIETKSFSRTLQVEPASYTFYVNGKKVGNSGGWVTAASITAAWFPAV